MQELPIKSTLPQLGTPIRLHLVPAKSGVTEGYASPSDCVLWESEEKNLLFSTGMTIAFGFIKNFSNSYTGSTNIKTQLADLISPLFILTEESI